MMLIAVSEGGARRFEVDENVDGFVVLEREIATGKEMAARLFRTAPAAFAYADLAAAMELCEGEDQSFEQDILRDSQARFSQARLRLADDGVPGPVLDAWRLAEKRQRSIHYH